ncbi:MAG: hypothetical protein ACRDZ4_01815 [Egibacteraceae bacterium]
MAEQTTHRSGRYYPRRSGARGNAFATRLDRLITLVGQRRRLEAVERPLRLRVAVDMTARYQQGGPDQFRRSGGLISLVVPRPRWEIFDQQAFAGWLVANGHSQLVTERVVVTDHACLVALVRATGRSGRVSQRKLNACVTVRVEADADAPEHLNVKVSDDSRLLTRDGETIPGVRGIIRDPWVQVCAAANRGRMNVVAGASER